MMRINIVKQYFSIAPFKKTIEGLGINTDRVLFNPTYFFNIILVFRNFIKLLSSNKLHQIHLLDLHLSRQMELYAPILVLKLEDNLKIPE
jgi:hypothetical protein